MGDLGGEGRAEQEAPGTTDGRHLRSARSRERILDALFVILDEGGHGALAERVAGRAGVSLRTLIRHFGSVEGLVAAGRDRIAERIRPMVERPFEGPLEERIAELVARRCEIFALVAPLLGRVSAQAARHPEIRKRRAGFDLAMRMQVQRALGAEIPASSAKAEAIDATLSLEAWEHMRTQQGLPSPRVALLLRAIVAGILADRSFAEE